jgi:hypothetical protein
MANARRDGNSVPTLLAGLESDGTTLVAVCADAADHALCVEDGTTGSDFGPGISPRDQNFIPALLAVSSADGITPVVVYATADGKLLVDSN